MLTLFEESVEIGDLVIIDCSHSPFNGLFAKVVEKAFGGSIYVEVLNDFDKKYTQTFYLFRHEFALPRVIYEKT